MSTTLTQPETNRQITENSSRRPASPIPTVRPRADIYEVDDAWLVVLEMPGVDEGGADVSLEKGVLTVAGEVATFAVEGYEPQYGGLSARRFERSFRLPEEVDASAIEAEVKAGILRIRLPKAAAALPTKVTVKAG
jgi:HSP20 family protein